LAKGNVENIKRRVAQKTKQLNPTTDRGNNIYLLL
jgi:hypothetical protein